MLGEEVFTVKEVATLLKVGEKTVYPWPRLENYLRSRCEVSGDSPERTSMHG